MSFRLDEPLWTGPALLIVPPIVTLSTDDEPEVDNDNGEIQVGQRLIYDDTGEQFYWNGEEWKPVTLGQSIALMLAFQERMSRQQDMMIGDVE